MTYRRSRAEIIAASCWPPLLEEPRALFARIKSRHPVGPWTVSVFEPEDRKLIDRRHFAVDEEAALQQWLSEVQLQFNSVQWFVASGKDAKQ
jgi:hypothetical protein